MFVPPFAIRAIHGVEPWAYLRDLLCLLPSWPKRRVLELAAANRVTTQKDSAVQERLAAKIFRRATLVGPGQLPVRQQAAAWNAATLSTPHLHPTGAAAPRGAAASACDPAKC